MSTPEPRSLAEIIGKGYQRWVIVSDGTNRASTHPPTKKPNGWHCPEPVTVDDMLAWLADREVFKYEVYVGIAVGVKCYMQSGRLFGTGDHPTLHEALCAAVRAVAGATSPSEAAVRPQERPEASSAVSDTLEPGERK